MPIKIGDHFFHGPFRSAEPVQHAPGIYLVIEEAKTRYIPIACGHSDDLRDTLEDAAHMDFWRNKTAGEPLIAILYTVYMDPEDREKVLEKIRTKYRFRNREKAF